MNGTAVAGPFSCLGHRWRVSSDDVDLVRLVDELFWPLRDPSTQPVHVEYHATPPRDGQRGEVVAGDESISVPDRPARVLGKIVWAINRQVIDGTPDRLLFHAAAAATPDGRVVLLPAPMESGKTTLVTGLLDRGLHYLTDEAAAVDPDLTVHGYAKPLSIDPGSWDVLRHHEPQLPAGLQPYMADQWQIPPHTFTTVVPSGQLALVVFPTYREGEPTRLEALDPIAALDLARSSTFGPAGRPLPAETIAELAAMVAAVPCYELRSGDLAGACDAVLSTLEDSPR